MKRANQIRQLQKLTSLREKRASNKLMRASIRKRQADHEVQVASEKLNSEKQAIGVYARTHFLREPEQGHASPSFQSIAIGVFKRQQDLKHSRRELAEKARVQTQISADYQECASAYKALLENKKIVDLLSAQSRKHTEAETEFAQEENVSAKQRGQE